MTLKLAAAALGAGASILIAGVPAPTASAAPTETAIDIMTKACDAYAGHQSLSMRAIMSVDNYYDKTRKTQKNFVVDLDIKMPDKYRTTWQGDALGSVFYNGKTVSVVDTKNNFFAQQDLSGDLYDFVGLTDTLNVPTPMLDLVNPKNCKESLQKVETSQILDDLILDGTPVRHLFFVNKVDQIYWEVWIKKDVDRYTIKKIVITSAYLKQQPQFEMVVLSEQLDPQLEDSKFTFAAPDDYFKIMFLENSQNPTYLAGENRRVARRTSRRTSRRVAYRQYYHALPSGCYWASPYYSCGGVYYEPVIENGTTVYVIVE